MLVSALNKSWPLSRQYFKMVRVTGWQFDKEWILPDLGPGMCPGQILPCLLWSFPSWTSFKLESVRETMNLKKSCYSCEQAIHAFYVICPENWSFAPLEVSLGTYGYYHRNMDISPFCSSKLSLNYSSFELICLQFYFCVVLTIYCPWLNLVGL